MVASDLMIRMAYSVFVSNNLRRNQVL